jgi:hypothetical protein
MPARCGPCPCDECAGACVSGRTLSRHASLLAAGVRARYDALDDTTLDQPQLVEQAPAISPGVMMSLEVAEQVARNRVSVTGAEAMLKITHNRLQSHLPEDVVCPASWYKCYKTARSAFKAPSSAMWHFCAECDARFNADPPVAKRRKLMRWKLKQFCRRCPDAPPRFCPDSGRPLRVAVYYSIEDKIRRTFAAKYIAKQVRAARQRTCVIEYVYVLLSVRACAEFFFCALILYLCASLSAHPYSVRFASVYVMCTFHFYISE